LRLSFLGFESPNDASLPLLARFMSDHQGQKTAKFAITNTLRRTIILGYSRTFRQAGTNWNPVARRDPPPWFLGSEKREPGSVCLIFAWVNTNDFPCRLGIWIERPESLTENLRYKIPLAWRTKNPGVLLKPTPWWRSQPFYSETISN